MEKKGKYGTRKKIRQLLKIEQSFLEYTLLRDTTKSLQEKTNFSVNSFPTPSYILALLRATLTFVPLSSSFFFSSLFCLFCLFFCLFARKCAQQ